jgi:hypothetical protein
VGAIARIGNENDWARKMMDQNRRTGGDFDYDAHGKGYAQIRRTDPRIAAMVHEALGSARTVLNVGAGAGSYEPKDRDVVAIEPSAVMRAQRPGNLTSAIHGFAEALPLNDQSVDAAMAMVTVHQWADLKKGLSELRRVTRGPIVVLTFEGEALDKFWLADYAPELIAAERRRYPSMDTIRAGLGGGNVRPVPVPIDCVDGFTEAYYARPEKFLEPAVRAAQSAWGFITKEDQARAVERLASDLASGAWDKKYARWRQMPYYEGSLRLIVSGPEQRQASE